jgi:hypothetical protein
MVPSLFNRYAPDFGDFGTRIAPLNDLGNGNSGLQFDDTAAIED